MHPFISALIISGIFSSGLSAGDSIDTTTISSPDSLAKGGIVGKTCNPAQLDNELQFLQIVGVRTNGGLEDQVIDLYGESLWQAASNAHPYLKNTDGALDSSTVDWLIGAMFTTYHKRTRETIIPFSVPSDELMKVAGLKVIAESSKGHFNTRLVFVSEEMRSAFRNYWTTDRFQETFLSYHLGYPPHSSESTLVRWSNMLHASLMKNDQLVVGTPVRPQGHKPVIEIWGHGTPNGTGIFDGAGNRIEAQDLVRTLKEQGLITPETRVKISACNGANCSIDDKLLSTVAEIEDDFKRGNLQIFMAGDEGSFLKKVRHEVTAQIPDHNSTVEGFLGTVNRFPDTDILHRDGTRGLSYYTSVFAKNGEEVKLNRKDMKIVLYRDFLEPEID